MFLFFLFIPISLELQYTLSSLNGIIYTLSLIFYDVDVKKRNLVVTVRPYLLYMAENLKSLKYIINVINLLKHLTLKSILWITNI